MLKLKVRKMKTDSEYYTASKNCRQSNQTYYLLDIKFRVVRPIAAQRSHPYSLKMSMTSHPTPG